MNSAPFGRFIECRSCATTRAALLCARCAHNRHVIESLRAALDAAPAPTLTFGRDFGIGQDPTTIMAFDMDESGGLHRIGELRQCLSPWDRLWTSPAPTQ